MKGAGLINNQFIPVIVTGYIFVPQSSHFTMRNVSITILFIVCASAVVVCAGAPAAVKSSDEQEFDSYVQHLQNEDGLFYEFTAIGFLEFLRKECFFIGDFWCIGSLGLQSR